ncbi:hypothetical protein [Pseudoflavonifractor sp. 60]|uniref:hypothetical protein n=1 Tax=Pseudoflavonifractor sp. 60 TaxID=2304576 RepID=UPI00136841EF|nr:hypothetical protein [Pseudoflavonifractor sp. 60]
MSSRKEEDRLAQLNAAFARLNEQEQNSALAILKTLRFAQSAADRQGAGGSGPERRPSG